MSQPNQPPPPQGYAPGPTAGIPYGYWLPEHPQGTAVLVLGILALVTGVTAPFAWYLGHKVEQEIRVSGRRYSNESQIQVGKILGIVGTIMLGLGVLFMIIYFVVIIMIFIPLLSAAR